MTPTLSNNYNVTRFTSRRSPVFAQNGMVAAAQPLATLAGVQILLDGGNAIDAAVASAAVLGVTEPYQTGLGGDCFALIYVAERGKVRALNASGQAPDRAHLKDYLARGHTEMPADGPLSWTVPGCVDGWCRMVAEHGSMPLEALLEPAIHYAANGFPVAPADAASWKESEAFLRRDPASRQLFLIDGRAPRAGEVLRQPALAETLAKIAKGGRDAFYDGDIARSLAAYSDRVGGLIGYRDLSRYQSEWQQPIGYNYRGYRAIECPPNSQGLAVLLSLAAIEDVDFRKFKRESPACWHILIESMKHAMVQAGAVVADPRFASADIDAILKNGIRFETESAGAMARASDPAMSSPQPTDTVYVAVVDRWGNAVSFINSIYGDFGSGLAIEELGFMMQNRAAGFSLDPRHPNALAPRKRPYHTIIPGLLLKEGRPAMIFGVTGGFMQPQGHAQLLVSIIDYGMDVQSAIDFPRFWWEEGLRVVIEDGLPDTTYAALIERGHDVRRRDGHRGFGGAQAIWINCESGILIGGSEPRQDGLVIGY